MKKTTLLIVMDGYGLAPDYPGNAITNAKTPNLDRIFSNYPNTSLKASGKAVGLPDGQMGNSEVGHMNIGAGRIVWQELTKINNAIEEKSFFQNKAICDAMHHAKEKNSALHLIGLLSEGGVHSHISHLFSLLDLAKQLELKDVFIHAFLDGRDVPPSSAEIYIKQLEEHMKVCGVGKIASIAGRYYAMDRDNRWDRVEKAYRCLTEGDGSQGPSAEALLKNAYLAKETDEFVTPGNVIENNKPVALINDNDAVIFFNFRPDRARELTRAFVDSQFNRFEREKIVKDLFYVCMTNYDSTLPHVKVAFPPQELKNTLGEYLSSLGKKQLRIAETEKYAHVTFFFNGGIEKPNQGEDRVLIPSPHVDRYDKKPEMSAYLIAQSAVEKIDEGIYDAIILNFANCDMVGHTGVMKATIEAVEAVDQCVQIVTQAVINQGGNILITADHGNADCMLDENGDIATAHSMAPVPLILISKNAHTLAEGGSLCDIAPTMLEIMNVRIPDEMTGQSLLRRAD
ncbi:MAG: 2,3-bisphosphoglycerate-independent phosphoglycerate mutase [Clostridia bacterium]|nr:2,3-bisphosphoglycerate-independent phosphoglycerate mutase [Clostridia bacterium]